MKFFSKGKVLINLTKGNFVRIIGTDEEGRPHTFTTKLFVRPEVEGIKIKRASSRASSFDVMFVPFDILVNSTFLSEYEKKELISRFDKENMPDLFALLKRGGDYSETIIVPVEERRVEVVIPEKITASQGKSDLKAYETPSRGMYAVFKPLVESIFMLQLKKAKDNVYNRLRSTIFKVQEALLGSDVSLTFSDLLATAENITPEEFERNISEGKLKFFSSDGSAQEISIRKDVINAAKSLSAAFRKYYQLLLFIRSSEKDKNKGKSGEKLKKLYDLCNAVGIKVLSPDSFVVPVIDFQAGSGRHIEVLKSEGFTPILFGTELRKIETEDQSNKVHYGVDFMQFLPFWQNEIYTESGTVKTAAKRPVYYLNPPYTTDGIIEKESIKAVPEGALMCGVFSTKVEKLIKNHIRGILFKVPREATGYDDPNSPAEFLIAMGVRVPPERSRCIAIHSKEENPDYYAGILTDALSGNVSGLKAVMSDFDAAEVSGGLKDWLTQFVNYYSSGNFPVAANLFEEISGTTRDGVAKRIGYTEELFSKIVKTVNDIFKNSHILKKHFEEKAEDFFMSFSPVKQALAGEKLFPDTRFFGEQPMLSIYEVVKNIPLLAFYKNNYPSIYNFVKEVAKKGNLDLPSLHDDNEPELVTTENLGVMKLRYYPKSLNVSDDVIETIIETMREKGDPARSGIKSFEETVRKLARISDRIIVKSITESFAQGEAVSFGYTSVLAFVDKFGKDLAAVSIPLSDFFEKLEEKGIINTKEKYRVAEPDDDLKEQLVNAFVKHLDWIKERYDLPVTQNFQSYVKSFKDGTVAEFLAQFGKENNLIQKMEKDVMPVIDAEETIYNSIKSLFSAKGLNLNASSIAREVASVYLKSPKKFYENREKATEFIMEVIRHNSEGENLPGEVVDDIVASVFEGIAQHYSVLDSLRTGALKLALEMFEAERIKRAKTLDMKWKIFERLFRSFLRIRPHQYREAVRLLAKFYKTGEGGHLLGWEMRSGKTLAMLSIGYFTSLLLNKDSYMFVKTANLNDIIGQALLFIPSLAVNFRVYRSGDAEPSVSEDRISSFLSDDIYPNLFALVSSSRKPELRDFFIGRGDTVNKLLETYAKEMEELIEIAEQGSHTLDDIPDSSPFSKVKLLPGFSDSVKLALYWYLERLADKGLIDTNTKVLNAFFEVLERFAEKFQEHKNFEKENYYGFTFHVVPKPQILAVNYRINQSRKTLIPFSGISVSVDKDYSFSRDEEALTEEELKSFISEMVASPYDDFFVTSREELFNFVKYHLDNEVFAGDRKEIAEALVNKLESVLSFEVVESGKKADGNPIVLVNPAIDKDSLSGEEFEFLEEALNKATLRFRTYKRYYIDVITNAIFKERGKRELFKNIVPSAESVLEENPEIVLENLHPTAIPVSIEREEDVLNVKYFRVTKSEPSMSNPSKLLVTTPSCVATVRVAAPSANKKASVEVIINGDPLDEDITISSSSNSRQYFVNSRFFKDRIGACIVDEIDEAVNPAAPTYKATYFLSRNAPVKVGGTGTPTSGYPETVGALLGVVSDVPMETVISTMEIIKESFSVYQLDPSSPRRIVPFFTLFALNSLSRQQQESFIRKVLSLKDYQPDTAAAEFIKFVSEANTDEFGQAKSLFVSELLRRSREEISPFLLGNAVVRFARDIEKFISNNGGVLTADLARFAVTEVSSQVAKRVAGTFDPLGFISSLDGASLSLNTRQNLKSESAGKRIVERKNFDLSFAVELEGSIKEKGCYYEDIRPDDYAPGSFSVRRFFDLDVEKRIRESLLAITYAYLKRNLEILIDAIKKNPEPLLNAHSPSPKGESPATKKVDYSVIEQALETFAPEENRKELQKILDLAIKDKTLPKPENAELWLVDLGDAGRCIYVVNGKSRNKVLEAYAFNVDNPHFSEYGSVLRHELELYGKKIAGNEEEISLYRMSKSLTPREVKNLISASTRSASDDMVNILKEYMKSNFNWQAVKDKFKLSSERLDLAKTIWNEFVITFVEGMENIIESYQVFKMRQQQESEDKRKKERFTITTASGYSVVPYVLKLENTQGVSSEIFAVSSRSDGPGSEKICYRTFGGNGSDSGVLEFSGPIVLSREQWSDIIKPSCSKEIEYNVYYLSRQDFEVIDSFTNKGYYERIDENARSGKSFLVTSPRVIPFVVGVYDALSALYDAKLKGENKKQVHFLIRISSPEIKEYLDRIDRKKLESVGIYIKMFNTNVDLDGESKKLKKELERERRSNIENTQLVVAAVDGTIARGVDLSHLEEMVVLGASSSGKTASQLYARLFDAVNKHEANIYTVGVPLRLRDRGRDEQEDEEIVTTASGSFYKVMGLLAKVKFIDDIVSGTLINVANQTAGQAIRVLSHAKEAMKELPKELPAEKTMPAGMEL